MFDGQEIRALLGGAARDRLDALDVLARVGSTNSWLLEAEPPAPHRCRVALTDHQTAGRGRRGNRWLSAPGASICLSLAYTFDRTPASLSSATLPVGVAAIRALEAAGVAGASLKWPNDIVVRDGKLGGILTERHGGGAGDAATIVVGIGLNADLDGAAGLDAAATRLGAVRDIASSVAGAPPSNEVVVALLIEQVYAALSRFATDGLEPFLEPWRRLDWLRGRRVTIDTGHRKLDGVCQGIDPDGALLLGDGRASRRILSGSVYPGERTGGLT